MWLSEARTIFFWSLWAQPQACLCPGLGLLDATIAEGRENNCDGSVLHNFHRLFHSIMWGKLMLLSYGKGEKWRRMSLIRNVLKIFLLILNVWAEIQIYFFLKGLWRSLVFNVRSLSTSICRCMFSTAADQELGRREVWVWMGCLPSVTRTYVTSLIITLPQVSFHGEFMPSRLWNQGNTILWAGSTQKISTIGALPYSCVHMPLLCRPSAFMWGHDVCLGRKDRLRQDRGRLELCFQGSVYFARALGWARVAAAFGRASAWAGLAGFALGPQKVPPRLPHIWSIFTPVLLEYRYRYNLFFFT